MSFIETLLVVIVSGMLGYLLGKVKEFRENKQKVYSQILPTITEMCFNPKIDREREYNSAMLLSWLYANKKVAKQLDKIASLIINSSRGDVITETQNLIVSMRKDIQPFLWQNLKAEKVKHVYTKIMNESRVINKSHLEETIRRLIIITKNNKLPWLHTFWDANIILELRQGIIQIEKFEDLLNENIGFSIKIEFGAYDYVNERIYESHRLYPLLNELYNLVKTDENNEFNQLFTAIENKDFKTTKRTDNFEKDDGLPF